MIEVCCAIILRDKKILTVQRGPVSSHPWQWEFPGGKILEGETAEQCIIREIQEELTVTVEVVGQLKPVGFDYGSKQIWLIPFVCKICSGKILLTEHIAMRWFNFEEWEKIGWAGADRELILKNHDSLKNLFENI